VVATHRGGLHRLFFMKRPKFCEEVSRLGNEEEGDKQWPWPGQSPHSEPYSVL
jgi:hypothetical protein